MNCTGVAAIICNDEGEILTLFHHKRQSTSLPTGTIDAGYTLDDTLVKEMQEELGISVKDFERLCIYPHSFEDVQYNTAIFLVHSFDGEVTNNEPEKHSDLQFNTIETLSLSEYNDPVLMKAVAVLKEREDPSLEGKSTFTPHESKEHKGWFTIPGYPSYYLANHKGELKNIKTGYETQGSLNDKGYRRACMWNNDSKKKKEFKVHRLICSAFHGPAASPDHEVGHKDDDRGNNKSSNLYWTTRADNMERVFAKQRKSKSLEEISTMEMDESELAIGDDFDPIEATQLQHEVEVYELKLEALGSALARLNTVISSELSTEDDNPFMEAIVGDMVSDYSQESIRNFSKRVLESIIKHLKAIFKKIKEIITWVKNKLIKALFRAVPKLQDRFKRKVNIKFNYNTKKLDVLNGVDKDTSIKIVESIKFEKEALDEMLEAIGSIDMETGEIDYKSSPSQGMVFGSIDDLADSTSKDVWTSMTQHESWGEDAYVEELSGKDIADHLGESIDAIKRHDEMLSEIEAAKERQSIFADKLEKEIKSGKVIRLSDRARDVLTQSKISSVGNAVSRKTKDMQFVIKELEELEKTN